MSPPPPPRRKPILLFGVQVALLAALLAWLPGAEALYPRLFHAQGNALFSSFGEGRVVRFGAPTAARGQSDTRMTGFARRQVEPRFTAQFRIHGRGYGPLVGVLALCLATARPWGRRLAAAALGALLIDAFTLAQVAGVAWTAFELADAGAGGSSGWARAARTAREFFNSELPRVVAVLLVWALVSRPGGTLDLRPLRAQWRDWRGRRGATGRPG